MTLHCFNQYQARGKVSLFGSYGDFPSGGHLRDFVSVEDVVKVNMFFLERPQLSGIFNVGSGRAQPFNDVALAVINRLRERLDLPLCRLIWPCLRGYWSTANFLIICVANTSATPVPTWSACALLVTRRLH